MIRPTHYKTGNPKYEVWQVVIDYQLSFFGGNVLKYIARAGRKGSEREDIEKALTYLQKAYDENIPLCNKKLEAHEARTIAVNMGVPLSLRSAIAAVFDNLDHIAISHLQNHLSCLQSAQKE